MKILIATDGSDFSKSAIEEACEMLAKGENNLVEIISVSEEVAHPVGEPFAVSTVIFRKRRKSGASRRPNLRAKPKRLFAGGLPIRPFR